MIEFNDYNTIFKNKFIKLIQNDSGCDACSCEDRIQDRIEFKIEDRIMSLSAFLAPVFEDNNYRNLICTTLTRFVLDTHYNIVTARARSS